MTTNPKTPTAPALLLALGVGVAAALAAPGAGAGVIVPDRATLNTLLGANAVNEGFENIDIADGSTLWTSSDPVKHIDSTTLFQGQGPGLVVPGIRIESTNPDKNGTNSWIQWNGNDYFGTDTKTIYADRALEIDFLDPTIAFGVDIKDYPDFRLTDEALVEVFAADDSTLLYSGTVALGPPVDIGIFFGYQHAAGIGSAIFHTSDPGTHGSTNISPQIDNLAFSNAAIESGAPEPAPLVLLIAGLAGLAFRRKAG